MGSPPDTPQPDTPQPDTPQPDTPQPDAVPRTLLFDTGDAASLVAAATEEHPSSVLAWFWPGTSPAPQSRFQAVRRKAQLLGLRGVAGWSPPGGVVADTPASAAALDTAQGLVQAAVVAAGMGIGRVVWPAAAGDDLDAVVHAAEQARLVERLVRGALEAACQATPAMAVRIDLPLLDLTPAQVVGLVKDLDAPTQGAWWCRREGPVPCGLCAGCMRWEAVYSGAIEGSAVVRVGDAR